jgi:Mrp family chromosome partitioning ATPase
MQAIVEEARKNFDYVVIDCPPAGVVADAAIIANYADSIIFVASEGKVSLSQVEYALSDLMTTKSDILGCIYNYADPKFLPRGGYFTGAYGNYRKYGNSYASSYYRASSSDSRNRRSAK